MTKEELEAAYRKAFKEQSAALREVDGEYLDHDRRQAAYTRLETVNAELGRLAEIERDMRASTLKGDQGGADER